MTHHSWQTTIVLMAVAWAAAYVAWQAARTLQASWWGRATDQTGSVAGCGGGCHGCPQKAAGLSGSAAEEFREPSASGLSGVSAGSPAARLVQLDLVATAAAVKRPS
jgi:hypothetical protein